MVTYAPMKGMNIGHDTCSPWRRASITCPSSWMRIMTTSPTPNVQLWNQNEYAAAEMKKPKNFANTKPHLSAVPPMTTAVPTTRSRRLPHDPLPIHSSPSA